MIGSCWIPRNPTHPHHAGNECMRSPAEHRTPHVPPPSCSTANLQSGATYDISVRAANEAGDGAAVDGRYQPISIEELADSTLQGYTEVLNLNLRWDRGQAGR